MEYPDKIIKGDGTKQQVEYIRKDKLNIQKVYDKYKYIWGINFKDTEKPDYFDFELWMAIKADLEIVE